MHLDYDSPTFEVDNVATDVGASSVIVDELRHKIYLSQLMFCLQ